MSSVGLSSKSACVSIVLVPVFFSCFFFFNDPAPTEFYPLSLHDALPIYLPQPLVRPPPVLFEEPEQRTLQRPGVLIIVQHGLAAELKGVDHLAVHVELELARGGVADPYRRRPLVTRQPARLPLGQPALARHPVHDLDVLRVPGDGAAQ